MKLGQCLNLMAKSKIVNFQNLLLLGILVLALFLRLWGLEGLGLPRIGYVDDEPAIADSALEMLRQDSLVPHWEIGDLPVYVQAWTGKLIFAAHRINPAEIPTYRETISAQKISASVIGVPYSLPEFYFWGRVSIAVMGGFSVVIVYFIGKAIKSNTIGLISAFFLAVTSLHVEYSHYLMRTIPGTFFLLLAFYLILLAYLKQKWWLYLLSFVLVYLAVYTKQNNLILLAPLGLALAMNIWGAFQHHSILKMAKYSLIIFCITAIIFILSWYFLQINVFIYAQSIFNRIFYNSYYYEGYHFGFSGENTPWWLIEQVFLAPSANWRLVALLAIPGIILAIQLKGKGWLLLSVLLPYSAIIGLFTVRFLHWLMPIVPIIALLAALSLEWAYEKIGQNTTINKYYLKAIFLLVIILIPGASIRTVMVLNYYGGQPDVRNTASEWMQANLPAGSRVVIDSWGPYLDAAYHDVIYVYYVGDKDLQAYRDENVNYIVINSINLSRIISASSDPRAAETIKVRASRIQQLMQELPLEHKFTGPALYNPPIVDVLIYKLQ